MLSNLGRRTFARASPEGKEMGDAQHRTNLEKIGHSPNQLRCGDSATDSGKYGDWQCRCQRFLVSDRERSSGNPNFVKRKAIAALIRDASAGAQTVQLTMYSPASSLTVAAASIAMPRSQRVNSTGSILGSATGSARPDRMSPTWNLCFAWAACVLPQTESECWLWARDYT